MTVFVLIDNQIRRASFREKLSRIINSKTGNEEEAQGELVLLKKYGILDTEDEITISNVKYQVLTRETLAEAPWYSLYNLKRITRNDRVY